MMMTDDHKLLMTVYEHNVSMLIYPAMLLT